MTAAADSAGAEQGAAETPATGEREKLAPGTPIIARSRYHRHTASLRGAGAQVVADEEYLVGGMLAADAIKAVESAGAARKVLKPPEKIT